MTNEEARRVASEVVSGLKSSPLLLGLVVLNAIGIGAAVWVLRSFASAQAARFNQMLELLRTICSHG